MRPLQSENNMVLVTGAAGFIGFHLCERLLAEGSLVVGLDNLNDYYDPALKAARLERLHRHDNFRFIRGDLAERETVASAFRDSEPDIVVNLAAQAGVRYSLENPDVYIQSNLVGFANVLEACRHSKVKHLLYASSSSVYGGNTKVPFSEADPVEHPVSLYAATKRSNELMADCYAHLYGIRTTGLRFFTVYGPFGRPDMAYYSFTDRYFSGLPITVFNDGDTANDLSRDFTYVTDVIESIVRLIPIAPAGTRPHAIYNIGGSTPERLTDFIALLERALGRALDRPVTFEKLYKPPQPGDVTTTYADSERLHQVTGFRPQVSLAEGLQLFADWYVEQHMAASQEGGS